MTIEQDLRSAFELHFVKSPGYLVRAPGRVNLIGEHTDYNDCFVLPMAIDRAIWIAFPPRADRRAQCEEAAAELGVTALKDVSMCPALNFCLCHSRAISIRA